MIYFPVVSNSFRQEMLLNHADVMRSTKQYRQSRVMLQNKLNNGDSIAHMEMKENGRALGRGQGLGSGLCKRRHYLPGVTKDNGHVSST